MKKNRVISIGAVMLGGLALSACGTPPAVSWPGLAADAERAYVASGTFIYAVDLESGEEVWRYPGEANGKRQFFSALALTEDGQLLAGSAGTDHAFVSIDPATGKDNWPAAFGGAKGTWLAPPLMVGERIYAPNSDGWLYVLGADGTPAGSIELGGSLWSAPVSDGNALYVASLDHHLHIVETESQRSTRAVDLEGAIAGGAVPGEGGVYVGSFTGKMEFVSADGLRQTLTEVDEWIWGAPALGDQRLYFADLGGNIHALDLASGGQLWGTVQPDGPVAASPLLVGERLIVVTESGSVHAFDLEGNEAWPKAYQTGGKIYTAAVSAGDLVLVAPYQAEFALAALDVDGKQAWLFTPEG